MRTWMKLAAAAAVLVLIVVLLMTAVARRGLSARDEPSAIERLVAGRMRRSSIPKAARNTPNPVPLSQEVLAEGRAHFADHCALCHGNDGRGQTEIGPNLYPKVPDLGSQATQSLTDGEIFYIIENGIRLTGMPAWGGGTHGEEHRSWHLVHFIRHLPAVTGAELAEMRDLNPKTRAEWLEEEEKRRFLEPKAAATPATEPTPHHHHDHEH